MMARGAMLVTLCCLFLLCPLAGQEIVRCPQPQGMLAERWTWGTREAARSFEGKEVWIGYSIQRLMDSDSYISSGHRSSIGEDKRRALRDEIEGDVQKAAPVAAKREFGHGTRIVEILKDVAILFRISQSGSESSTVLALDLADLDLTFNRKGLPLLWLGNATDDESLNLLKEAYGKTMAVKVRKSAVLAIGIHQSAAQASSFLKEIVESEADDEVRSQAVFWLVEQEDENVLQFLTDIVERDRSSKVREQAVFALSRLDSDESTDVLINLARKHRDPQIRGKATFWLGQKASEKAGQALQEIVSGDDETDVQRQAVFALARMKQGDGIECLIKIAQTHPNPRVKKEAIRALGQSDDQRALDALVRILRSQ